MRGSPFFGGLRQYQRQAPASPFVFVSERDAPLTAAGFSRMVERAGAAAGFGIKAHAHMLRHACGYALANLGVDTRALQASRASEHSEHRALYSVSTEQI
jgi:type 1 fimbriae regulatory protein FimB/type 1 fimbriae regulatory protein FimE